MAKNVLRGKNLLVKYKGTLIPLSTSAKITLGTNTVDSTTKEDDEDWDEVDIASHNWSITADRLLNGKYSRTTGTLAPSTTLALGSPVAAVGSSAPLTLGSSGLITEPISLNAGDRYTSDFVGTTPPDMLMYVDDFKVGHIATAVHAFTPTEPTYTAEQSGTYFISHYSTPSHADTYKLNSNADPLATLLADLPLEAPIIVDIDGDQYTGNALITQHDFDGSVKQNQTHSLTLTGTGELTKITN